MNSAGKVLSGKTAAACLLLVLAAIVLSLHVLDDTDLLWHLKTGELIAQNGPPCKDVYSFVAAGREWIDSQWLFQLLIYGVWRVAGFAGLSLLLALVIAAAWILLLVTAHDRRTQWLALPIMIISLWGAKWRFVVRPEIFTFLLMAVFLLILERGRQTRPRIIWLLVPLQMLWANLQGLWPIGPALIAAYLMEDLLAPKLPAKLWTGPAPKSGAALWPVLAACLAVSFITPYHYKGFFFPLVLLGQVASPGNPLGHLIAEFLSPFHSSHSLFLKIPLLIIILLSATALVLDFRRLRIAHLLIWAAFLTLALSASRNAALFCIVAGAFATIHFTSFLTSGKAGARPGLALANGVSLGLAVAMVALFAAGAISNRLYIYDQTYRRFGAGFAYEKYPVDACEFLKQVGWKGKIFNQMAMAGYLVWKGYPDWQIYIDGRLEVYGQKLVMEAIDAEIDYRVFADQDRKYGFDAALVNYRLDEGRYLAQDLLRDLAWAPVYADNKIMIFLKYGPEQLALIRNYEIDPAELLPLIQ